tara:strand:- start:119 stop:358 length:240 start_codon:yes stop_codon:yes gene_type:complete
MQRQNHLENYFSGWKKNQLDSGITSIKTTPQNVKEAHEALFHATMNLPNAAAHCGMTIKQLKLTFREYLKYNEPDDEIV